VQCRSTAPKKTGVNGNLFAKKREKEKNLAKSLKEENKTRHFFVVL
jgi:hypothetical protein